MKFDVLLAQYLYQNKTLSLPGIGTFETDTSVTAGEAGDKQRPSLQGISFRNASVNRADDDLIEYIKEHTGKMKPLAISDLESYITLGKQFLYIGKPFYLEGIGTLKLMKDGRFEFTPGEYVTTKLDDPNVERSEGKKKSVHEENRIVQESTNNNIKKVLLALGFLGGIALIGWGSMHLYNLYASRQGNAYMVDSTSMLHDSTASMPHNNAHPVAANNNIDTAVNASAGITEVPDADTYKFVVETTQNKLRAMNRYGVLKSYGNKIQLSTSDSLTFKLFYVLHAVAADTTRIRDSLNRWYYGNTNTIRVKIEQ